MKNNISNHSLLPNNGSSVFKNILNDITRFWVSVDLYEMGITVPTIELLFVLISTIEKNVTSITCGLFCSHTNVQNILSLVTKT